MTPKTLGLLVFVAVAVILFWDRYRKGQSVFLPMGLFFLALVLPAMALPFLIGGLFLFRKSPSFISYRGMGSSPQRNQAPSKMCSKCGHDNPATATTCSQCGNTLTV